MKELEEIIICACENVEHQRRLRKLRKSLNGWKPTTKKLAKIPFKCVCHMSLESEHIATYEDESGRLGFCTRTAKVDEFTFGRATTHYRIDEKIYKSKKKFLEALKDFSFKVVPIRT